MFGDRPGSPRRDDRQSFGPLEPWPPAAPAEAEAPAPYEDSAPHEAPASHEDDVKVAGPQDIPGAAPAGDTLGFQPVAGQPHTGLAADAPDEIVAGTRGPGAPRPSGGAGRRNGIRIVAIAAGAAVVLGGGAVAAFAVMGGSGGKDPDKAIVATKPLADAAAPPQVDPKVMEAQRRKQALDRASRAVHKDGGKGPSLLPKGSPIPTKKPEDDKGGGGTGGGGGPSGDPVPAGEAQAIAKRLMPGYGKAFTGSGQFGCLVNLWNKESHWNTHAANPSGAYGIPQALPGSKMASAGSDWQNSATTQIKWGLGYIKDRYGSPCGAWSHSQSVGWY